MLVTFTPPLPQGEGTTVLGSDGCSYVIKGGCPIVAAPVDVDTVDGYSAPGVAPAGITDSITGEPIVEGAPITVFIAPDGSMLYKDCTDENTFGVLQTAAEEFEDSAGNTVAAGSQFILLADGSTVCAEKPIDTVDGYPLMGFANGITTINQQGVLIPAGAETIDIYGPDGVYLYSKDCTDDNDFGVPSLATAPGVAINGPYDALQTIITFPGNVVVCVPVKDDELGPSLVVDTADPTTFPADSGVYEKQCLVDASGFQVGYVDATGVHLINDKDEEVGPDVVVDPDDPASWPTTPTAPHVVQFLCDATGQACAILTASGVKAIPKPKDEIGPALEIDPGDSATWPANSGAWEKRCLNDADGNMVGYVDSNGVHLIDDEDDEVGPNIEVDPEAPSTWPTAPTAPHDLQFLCRPDGVACGIVTASGVKRLAKPLVDGGSNLLAADGITINPLREHVTNNVIDVTTQAGQLLTRNSIAAAFTDGYSDPNDPLCRSDIVCGADGKLYGEARYCAFRDRQVRGIMVAAHESATTPIPLGQNEFTTDYVDEFEYCNPSDCRPVMATFASQVSRQNYDIMGTLSGTVQILFYWFFNGSLLAWDQTVHSWEFDSTPTNNYIIGNGAGHTGFSRKLAPGECATYRMEVRIFSTALNSTSGGTIATSPNSGFWYTDISAQECC